MERLGSFQNKSRLTRVSLPILNPYPISKILMLTFYVIAYTFFPDFEIKLPRFSTPKTSFDKFTLHNFNKNYCFEYEDPLWGKIVNVGFQVLRDYYSSLYNAL